MENCLNFCRKNSGRFLKNALCVSGTTTWGKCFFEHSVSSFSCFWTLIKNSLDGFEINWLGLPKLHFTCPAEFFESNMTFSKKIKSFFLFETLSENVWTFVEKNSDSVVKMELYLSRGRFVELFLHIFYFSVTFGIERKVFGFSTEVFYQGL